MVLCHLWHQVFVRLAQTPPDCSSLYRLFFIASSISQGAILSNYASSRNFGTGHCCDSELLKRIEGKLSLICQLRYRTTWLKNLVEKLNWYAMGEGSQPASRCRTPDAKQMTRDFVPQIDLQSNGGFLHYQLARIALDHAEPNIPR